MNASIIEYFSILKDPRIERHKKHKLVDIIVLAICAVLSGAEGWEAIEEYGHAKLKWLRKFIPLENGVPTHDTIARVLSRVSAKGLQECFLNWVRAVQQATEGQLVAIDGKRVRRSFNRSAGRSAIHMVSAWGSANGLVLGQLKTDAKSNEITAIPQLLELLELKGCIVTLDAMGCQTDFELRNPPMLQYKKSQFSRTCGFSSATSRMQLQVYHWLKDKVKFLYHKLELFKYENTTGRKLSLPLIEVITLSLYKQTQNIATKKALWKDFQPPCSYKTLTVSMNRCALIAFVILMRILHENRKDAHLVKHTDSTDIPVCLPKNAKRHKTMYGLAEWGHSGKGWFYGIKLHLTADLKRKILSFSFSPGNTHGTKIFLKLNKDLDGIFVADAEFVSEDLQKEFHQEHKRILFAKPRKNMKKIITAFQKKLYDTRMRIELDFRNLKMFFGLVTSLPRSISGYFANYIYAMLAYALR